ncbi:MAG: hypothetical protein Q8936_13360 [Bacillota bacterium]|nr:hypothetical protein [Bacillota bacterium]
MGIFDLFKKVKQKDDITDLIYQVINVMESYTESDNEEDIVERIETLTKNSTLTWELYCFIPTVYGRILFPEVKFSDEAIIIMPDGSEHTKLLYDFFTYNHVKKVVVEKLKLKISRDKIEKVLLLGAEINALNNALNDGSQLSDLIMGPLMLRAPENYILTDG